MTDTIIKAVNTGLACGTPVATAAFVGTPGFIADDLAFGGIATVTCGVASLFGVDVRDAVVKGWYGIEEVSKEAADELTKKATDELAKKVTDELAKKAADELAKKATDELAKKAADELAKKAADELAKKAADELAKKAADELAKKAADELAKKAADELAKKAAEELLKRTLEEAAKAGNTTIIDTCEAVLTSKVPPVVIEQMCTAADEIAEKAAAELAAKTWSETAQNALVSGFSAAKTGYDFVGTNYTNYVGSYLPTWADQSIRSLSCSPVFILKAGYNMGSALYNGKSVALALVDTTVSAGITLVTKAGVEVLSNATGVSSAYLDIPAQIATQTLYSGVKSAVVHGFNNFKAKKQATAQNTDVEKAANDTATTEVELPKQEQQPLQIAFVEVQAEQKGLVRRPSQENLLAAAKAVSASVQGLVAVVKDPQQQITTRSAFGANGF